MTKKRRKRPPRRRTKSINYYDYSLLAILVCLMCFGLVMLYSTSSYSALVTYGDSMYYFKRQLIFTVSGLVVMYIVSRFPYQMYIRLAKPVYVISIIVMLLVQTPLGKEVNGARRWIRLPFGMTFQAAELAKIAVILFIPVLICQMGKEISRRSGAWQIAKWGGLCTACVLFLTDNLSTSIIVAGIVCILYFVAHPKTKEFIAFVSVALAAIIGFVVYVGTTIDSSDNFRLRRIIAWLAPEKYAEDLAYQPLQGLYAIGSGGLFGKGLGNSVQKMKIPEVQNDMILTVICEELGIFGAIIIFLLFGMLLYRLMFIAQNAPDLYSSLVVTGVFAHIAIQVVLNVAVVTNTIPNTGITLPFVSYGGTSIWFLAAEMGIVLGISKKIKFEENVS